MRRSSQNAVAYVDDSYLQGDTYHSCLNNVLANLNLLRGLVIYPEKSILILSQKVVFLEFISSKKITLTLNDENKIKNEGTNNDSLPKQ